MKHGTCINCKYYDGCYCKLLLENAGWEEEENMFKAPFDYCYDYEEDREDDE